MSSTERKKERRAVEDEPDGTESVDSKNSAVGLHSLTLSDVLGGGYEVRTKNWSSKTATDSRHHCQDPFKVLGTILHGTETKRRTLHFTVMRGENGSMHVMYDREAFKKEVKSGEMRGRLEQSRTVDSYVRRLTYLEEAVFQGVGFLSFPSEMSDTKIHGLIGNSFPPRVAACVYQAMDEVQRLRGDRRTRPDWGWENRTILDLFAGLGGMSMGVDYTDLWCKRLKKRLLKDEKKNGDGNPRPPFIIEPLGFEHLALVDFSPVSIEMLKNVEPNSDYYKWRREDVIQADASECRYAAFRGKVGLLTGGPPCQPFSMAGKRKGMQDSRSGWAICAKALLETEAEAFFFENVKAVTKGAVGKAALAEIRVMLTDPWSYFSNKKKECKRKGTAYDDRFVEIDDRAEPCPYVWTVEYKVVVCSDYGVPQNRERCLFLGFRKERELEPSKPKFEGKKPKRTKKSSVEIEPSAAKTKEDTHVAAVFDKMAEYAIPDKRTAWSVVSQNARRHDRLVEKGKAKLLEKFQPAHLWKIVPDQYRGITK
jgi:site-specific DNA-cytosine methylase